MATCIHCGNWFEGGSAGEQSVCLACRNQFASPPAMSSPTPMPAAQAAPSFDPYYTWLGIPPEKQPPNHYQLLGLVLLEPNGDVIQSAVDRQSAYLRSLVNGANAHHAQRLLAEVDVARICLLNAQSKEAYDQVVARTINATAQPQHAPTQSQSVSQMAGPAAGHSPATAAAPQLLQPASPASSNAPQSASTTTSPALQRRRRNAKPKRSPAVQLVQIVVGGIVGCLLGYFFGFVLIPAILQDDEPAKPVRTRQVTTRPSTSNSTKHKSSNHTPAAGNRSAQPQRPTASTEPSRNSNNSATSHTPTPRDTSSSLTAQPVTQSTPNNLPTSSPNGAKLITSTTPKTQTTSPQPAPPQSPTPRSQPPPPQNSPRTLPPRTLGSLVSASGAVPNARALPLAMALPERNSSIAQRLTSIPTTFTVESPTLLTDAAGLQDGEFLYLEESEDAGVKAWTVCTAIPDAATAESAAPREIAEFTCSDNELSFRWFSSATAEDESMLMNSMLRMGSSEKQEAIAMREPVDAQQLDFDMNERRSVEVYTLPAPPAKELLMLELDRLIGFPAQARFESNTTEVSVGQSATIVFDGLTGAEIEIKFQGLIDNSLTIAVSPQFRENSASVVAMTKKQLETTMRSLERTITRTEADIRTRDANVARWRRQDTSRMATKDRVGLAGLINQTQSRADSDRRKLVGLRAKLENGPKINDLLDALHHRPTLGFRITAKAGSGETITLVNGGWSR